MGDYIERQIAFDAVQDVLIDTECPEFVQRLVDEKFDKIPTAKVHEDYFGKWIKDKETGEIYCSECKERAIFNSGHYYICSPFCPYCGARMVGIIK